MLRDMTLSELISCGNFTKFHQNNHANPCFIGILPLFTRLGESSVQFGINDLGQIQWNFGLKQPTEGNNSDYGC